MNLCFLCELRYGSSHCDVTDLVNFSLVEDEDEEKEKVDQQVDDSKTAPELQDQNDRDTQQQQTEQETSGKSSKRNHPCDICLGILLPKFRRSLVDSIVNEIRKEKFDARDFNIGVSFPTSCRIREICLTMYLCIQKPVENLGLHSSRSLPQISLRDICRILYTNELRQRLNIGFNQRSEFKINICLENAVADTDCVEFFQIHEPGLLNRELQRRRKRRRMQQHGRKVADGNFLSKTFADEFEQMATVDQAFRFLSDLEEKSVEKTTCTISFSREPVYLAGKYCKYSRYLTQTPWFADGERVGESSVQEIICEKLVPIFGASDYKFMAAGREDKDVRMLGEGRPFAVVLLNPRKRYLENAKEELEKFRAELSASTKDVGVPQIHSSNALQLKVLKMGEEEKRKTYTALCYCKEGVGEEKLEKLNEIGTMPTEIAQRTPIRVLHRRNLAIRKREILQMHAVPVDGEHFVLRLTAQAGTYVKEFVHGDFGRSVPSLGDLMEVEEVDILELDVEAVDLPWPPIDSLEDVEEVQERVRAKRRRRLQEKYLEDSSEGDDEDSDEI